MPVTFIRALGFDQVDLFGFSMGGMIAQVIARRSRARAQGDPRRNRPRGGEGIDKVTRISYLDTARGLLTRQDPKHTSHQDCERAPGREGLLARLEERKNGTTRPSP